MTENKINPAWPRERPAPVHGGAGSAAAAVAPGTLTSNIALSVPVRRIATFHLNGLGDLIFTLPALQALRDSFPGASICTVVRPALAPLLHDSPLSDEVLLRPKGGLSAQATLMAKLHSHHFDLTVAFSQSRNTTLLVWSTGAGVRAGYEGAKMEALLTHRIPRNEGPYTVESHLDLVRSIGCNPRQHDYSKLLQANPRSALAVDTLLAANGIEGPFLMVACEASDRRGIKEWPVDHWTAALGELAERWPVVLVGTRRTEEVTVKLGKGVVDLGGQTDLLTLAALAGKARLFIGIDSGVLHLAAAMGTPVVGIYGPTSWELTGPLGVPHRIVRHPVDCSPCLLSQCKWSGAEERKCLIRLQPEQVVQAVKEMIGI